MFRHTSVALLAAAALLFAAPALAVPITYTIQQGETDGGFGFSGLHDADDDTPMSGDSLGDLSGTLTLHYDAGFNNYTFVSSTISLDSDDYTFEIVSGMIEGSGQGFLGFVLEGAGSFAQTGEIVFAGGPVCCGFDDDAPNHITPTEFKLWGAVDIPASDGQGYPKRFGMDLAGSAAVPEPSAAMVFGIGIVLVRTAVRRRSN